MLKFGRGNAKLDALEAIVGGQVWTFSLLSGWSCPFASQCLSKAIRVNGKTTVKDGPNTQFRCFSASEEAVYPNVYNSREHNFSLLKQCADTDAMVSLISESLPKKAKCIRIHVGGDMFSQDYFDAWCIVAKNHPDVLFYAYTKSLPYWLNAQSRNIIPDNLILTASYGGRFDNLIKEFKLRHAVVIADTHTVNRMLAQVTFDVIPTGPYKGYPVDHTDEHAALPQNKNQSFALLLHGTQPKDSIAASVKRVLNGVGSYSRRGK